MGILFMHISVSSPITDYIEGDPQGRPVDLLYHFLQAGLKINGLVKNVTLLEL